MLDNSPTSRIVIVGGGTAGWLTAGILAAEHHVISNPDVSVTLIESPDVAILGVGEGTWPTMRDTLRKIGISEFEFIGCCDASFKQGSRFINWQNGQAGDIYDHPFALPQGFFEADMVDYWQQHREQQSFAATLSSHPALCDANKAPKQWQTPEYAGVVNYGYHLDAGKFAQLLQRHCTQTLGVKHILDHIEGVEGDANGNIQSVVGQRSGKIAGDIFIDCSGFAALLIGKHYQVPFVDCKDTLFNDTALAVQVPYQQENAPIASATLSTAQSAGWIWDIGLPTRRGVGYVYSSTHSSQEQAEQHLRHYIGKDLGDQQAEQANVRKISIRPGHRQLFWQHNCVAIGTSAGFLEPLEASALVLIEMAASMLSERLPVNEQIMALERKRFNEVFSYRWQRIIDFLKLHYVLSKRTDSTFWQDNKSPGSIPDSLQELLTLWQFQRPSKRDFPQIEEIFPAASYQYVLYGMGFETNSRSSRRSEKAADAATQQAQRNQHNTRQYLAGLPGNRELINQIYSQKTSVSAC